METGDESRGDAVESVEPGDFLDEVDFARQIIPEGGGLPDGRIAGGGNLFHAAEPGQIFFDHGQRDFDAEQAFDPLGPKLDRIAQRKRPSAILFDS